MEEHTKAFAQDSAILKDIQRSRIRALVKLFYDLQKERIAIGNRIVSYFRLAAGLSPQEPDKPDLDPEEDALLQKVLLEYYAILDSYNTQLESSKSTPRISTFIKNFANKSYILSETEYVLCQLYADLVNSEERLRTRVEKEVQLHPMWDAFFSQVKGCGPLMSAVCLAYFDPYAARHCSSFWKYAGLDTVVSKDKDGKEVRQGRRAWHTEKRTYIDKDGNEGEKVSLAYNPFVKTKLVGVLGSCFVKSGGKYRQIYDDYKFRLQQRGDGSLTPGHIHAMANRYAVKMFLRDMWVAWRTLEGLPVSDPYEVVYLGHKPHGYNY